MQAAAASVWIQIGLGLWLLVAPRGLWSRFGGLASVGWGLVVWVFGEAFGGIFAPGLTWLFGAPGAVLIYCVAGVLVALPDRRWATPRTGRIVLAASGVFFIAMAVLQAWPGRGYWQGRLSATNHVGTLAGMVAQMARTPQPGFLASWVSSFGRFDSAHGWAVNLVVVIFVGGIGVALCTGRRRVVLPAVIAAVVFCLADWVLVEDLGFLGGNGTDPNSMVPTALVLVAGYVAMVRLPVPINETAPAEAPSSAPAAAPERRRWWEWVTPGYLLRMFAALGAVVVVLVGTAPMTLAATNPNADPIISQALNGTPNIVDTPAPPFTLTNQRGAPVSLSSLRGHTIALTFLDPVCTSDCPLIAQEFRQADERLGSLSAKVDFVAIVANPIYRSISFTNAFDRQEGLAHMGNWLYLTGSLSQLRRVWNSYGVLVETSGAGAMIAHSDLAFVIDGRGHERAEMEDDPGAGGPQSSSFSSLLLARISAVERVSGRRGRLRALVNTVAVVGQITAAGVIGAALGTSCRRGRHLGPSSSRGAPGRGPDHGFGVVGGSGHGPARRTAEHVLADLFPGVRRDVVDAGHTDRRGRQRGPHVDRRRGRFCHCGFRTESAPALFAAGPERRRRLELDPGPGTRLPGGRSRCGGRGRPLRTGPGTDASWHRSGFGQQRVVAPLGSALGKREPDRFCRIEVRGRGPRCRRLRSVGHPHGRYRV